MKPELKAVLERWDTFLGKVRQRVDAVLGEADVGFDQVIATNVTDAATMSGAVSAFEARMQGLGTKIDQAWDKIDEELRSGSALKRRDKMIAQGDALRDYIEVKTYEMSVLKRAQAARALWQIVTQDAAQPHHCTSCGGQLQLAVYHTSSSVPCGFCGAVNQVQPSTAIGQYYYGGAIHALSEEVALQQWHALHAEEQRFQDIRGASAEDKARLRAATEHYWRTYCTAHAEIHPDWTPEQIEAEVAGKMGSFDKYHQYL